MTMAPDPHAPHPCRAFDDPTLVIPPPPAGRMAVSPPEPRAPLLHVVLLTFAEAATFLFTLIAGGLLMLLAFGDDATINAWGLWARGLVGG